MCYVASQSVVIFQQSENRVRGFRDLKFSVMS